MTFRTSPQLQYTLTLKRSRSGKVLLCVQPSSDDGIHAVKWHPKDPNTLAVASDNKLYVIDLATVHSQYRDQPITLQSLTHISQTFTVSSVSIGLSVTSLSSLNFFSVLSRLTLMSCTMPSPLSP